MFSRELISNLSYCIQLAVKPFTPSGSTGASGPRLFTIHLVDIETNNLPKAHTWLMMNTLNNTFLTITHYHL